MPKAVEERLFKQAHKLGKKGEAAKHYVYGTMTKLGMMDRGKKKSR